MRVIQDCASGAWRRPCGTHVQRSTRTSMRSPHRRSIRRKYRLRNARGCFGDKDLAAPTPVAARRIPLGEIIRVLNASPGTRTAGCIRAAEEKKKRFSRPSGGHGGRTSRCNRPPAKPIQSESRSRTAHMKTRDHHYLCRHCDSLVTDRVTVRSRKRIPRRESRKCGAMECLPYN